MDKLITKDILSKTLEEYNKNIPSKDDLGNYYTKPEIDELVGDIETLLSAL